jgi:acetylornithine deacetylase/succinyl-diaminopimelate desuccinylase-like protein
MKDQMITARGQISIMILDCCARPTLSLAENAQGTKAICSALKDILWFSDYVFQKASGSANMVGMTVTSVTTGKGNCADLCNFTVEIRYDQHYTRDEIVNNIRKYTHCNFSIREDLSMLAGAYDGIENQFEISR